MKYVHQKIAFYTESSYKTGILSELKGAKAIITQVDGYKTQTIHVDQIIGRVV